MCSKHCWCGLFMHIDISIWLLCSKHCSCSEKPSMLPPLPRPMSALPSLHCTDCQSHLRAIYTYIYLAVVLNKYTMWELSGEPCRFRTLDFNPIACLESIDSVVMTGWGKGGKGTWQGGKDWRLNSGLGSDCLWEYTV